MFGRPRTAAPTPTPRSDHRAAVTAGFLGWTLDAFDFFLVVMCLTAIAKEFGKSDAQVAFSLTLTLIFRPVGAFIFGLLADRYGRRLPLMIDLVFYSLIEVLTGFAPSFTTFLVLRALFGIGMGGEWGGGASPLMEKRPPPPPGAAPADPRPRAPPRRPPSPRPPKPPRAPPPPLSPH